MIFGAPVYVRAHREGDDYFDRTRQALLNVFGVCNTQETLGCISLRSQLKDPPRSGSDKELVWLKLAGPRIQSPLNPATQSSTSNSNLTNGF